MAADRFQTTFLGSRALVGSLLQPSNLLRSQGADGLSVEQVLQQHGFNPTPDAVSAIALTPDQVADFQMPVGVGLMKRDFKLLALPALLLISLTTSKPCSMAELYIPAGERVRGDPPGAGPSS